MPQTPQPTKNASNLKKSTNPCYPNTGGGLRAQIPQKI